MATNPADSMPVANEVARAIKDCPFVVVSDVVEHTDTTQLANVQLPAQAWSEKSGTVSNSERRISRQRAFKTPPSLARPDWWAICQVALRMGYEDGFNFSKPSEIFSEYAGLSEFENLQTRDFDIGAYANTDEEAYNDLLPFQWPKPKSVSKASRRFFSDGRFYTPDRKARFVAINALKEDDVSQSAELSTTEHSLVLNTGRIRDQWHTMTRTGQSTKLLTHIGEPFVEINPDDAAALKINDASLVDVSSATGTVTVRALITTRTQAGSIFIPMHWNGQFASNARVNVLVRNITCPVSGQPALKNQRVSLQPSSVGSYGFMLARSKPTNLKQFDYWAIAPVDQGWKLEFASQASAKSMMDKLLDSADAAMLNTNLIQYEDAVASNFRYCRFSENNLVEAVYLSAAPVTVARQASSSFLSHQFDSQSDRLAAVSGAGFVDRPDVGAIVCSCMNVGANTIWATINSGCQTLDSIGTACGAGTQCGSCRSEIVAMLKLSHSSEQVAHICA